MRIKAASKFLCHSMPQHTERGCWYRLKKKVADQPLAYIVTASPAASHIETPQMTDEAEAGHLN